jgi:hypothetical protein
LIVSLRTLSPGDELLVNGSRSGHRFLWMLLPCAIVLVLAAWLRGAEYDEQYTLFLTAGVPRPAWPAGVFPAGLARDLQSGTTSLGGIAHDLRTTDVHPPLYFWLVSLWQAVLGHDLFVARLLSVVLGLAALALTGVIARVARLPPVWAMALTLGCYGFAYTSVVARGFALAQLLLLGGVLLLLTGRRLTDGPLTGRRLWHFAVAGMMLGAATLANYLAVFVAMACLLAVGLERAWPPHCEALQGFPERTNRHRGNSPSPLGMLLALAGFLIFIPADLWWFLAQRGSRQGQFPPFSLGGSLVRLAVRFSGDILGGLPVYLHGAPSMALTAGLGVLLIWLFGQIAWHWRDIGKRNARIMFGLAALAPPCGLLVLGAIFNTTPIEVRYLSFSTPFVGLLLAGALRIRGGAIRLPRIFLPGVLISVQAVSIAGLMLAPQTMQPARAAARAAAELARDGVVLLPEGNDGVGVTGAFAIEAPPALPLLLVRRDDSADQIRARVGAWRRVVLALLEQDDASRAESATMRRALTDPGWREVARGPNVAVYERAGGQN